MGAALARLMMVLFRPFFIAIVDIFKRGALRRVAAWSALIALIAALYIAVNAVILGISWIMPDFLNIAASWIIPNNFKACVTSWLAGTTLISVYKWKQQGIQFTLGL